MRLGLALLSTWASLTVAHAAPDTHAPRIEVTDAGALLFGDAAPSACPDVACLLEARYASDAKAKKLALPDTATVRRAGEAGTVQLFMAKTLSFAGHPPGPMSTRGARKHMECAARVEGDALVVATYGEWDSRIEGGAHLKLVAVVPDGIEVEQRKGLSGPDSAGQERHGQDLTQRKDAREGYWYGPASPADGWTAVPAVPDPERRAGK